ncbi:MAG: class I SAM-dependent DNA methyltransferase [Candidatus Methylumidiphilus sp.]
MSANANLNLLRTRAAAFAKDFAKSTYEMGEAQDFIRGLCQVFGLNHRRAVRFEERVKKLGGKRGRIDGFFPGLLLVEMKSTGEDLEQAYVQATDYFPGLKDGEVPRYVLVSDFSRLHLYDLEAKTERLDIPLADLPQHIEAFLFLAGYEAIATEHQEKINKLAAEQMAGMHDALKATGYTGQDLETYLVRLLFCLFADDTGLFGAKGRFLNLLVNHSRNDGTDLHGVLQSLFDTLNRPEDKRSNKLPEHLAAFPYVNGELFKGTLAQCYFDEAARTTLIDCAGLDWSDISPAIFGSLFQAIMHFDDEAAAAKSKKRREFGAHYTSEANILKAIRPLFLDDLQTEFLKIRRDKKKLAAFHQKLSRLNFFDPACGCGNFLVIAYRELRLLELDVIEALRGGDLIGQLDVDTLILCDVDQFHGIEIDGSAAQIAIVALWLTDHQMNLKVQRFGNYYTRIPLVKRANIVCGNALRLEWSAVLPPDKCSFIMGNPPFVGAKFMSDDQRADIAPIFKPLKNGGLLDYVAAWHVKAVEYIQANPAVSVAFVSTNSICQGEQVGALWPWLLRQGIKIHFAHRTFRWSNEGRGVAAVHCVILGYGLQEPAQRTLFDYGDDIKGEPMPIAANNINPYLADAPDLVIDRRSKPLCTAPEMGIGNKPIDGGNYLFTPEDKDIFIAKEPGSAQFFRRWLGADEFLNGYERWCLWLGEAEPDVLKQLPLCKERVAAVRKLRANSKSAPTQKLADTPRRFHVEFMPDKPFLVIPEVSSERRRYIPIGFFEPDTLASNLLRVVSNATRYHFGVLSSSMHNAWMRTVGGRLKSDYRYSVNIVYNNFPWPTPTETQIKATETQAQAVLDARAAHPASTLADLYDPLTMPVELAKAHAQLDKAVDAAYGYPGGKDDAARVAFLFELYPKLSMTA